MSISDTQDRVFPNQIINTDNNTVEACLNQCALFGYPAAVLEFGDECCEYSGIDRKERQTDDIDILKGVVISQTSRRTVQVSLMTVIATLRALVIPSTFVAVRTDCRSVC